MAFSAPSNTIVAVPIGVTGTPTILETKLLDQMRAIHVSSPNLLAWIQLVKPAEPIDGHVKFGYDPDAIKDAKTEGPSALISMATMDEIAEGEQNTFSGDVSIRVRYLWWEDKKDPDAHIAAMNFVIKIKDEVLESVPFHPTEGGEVGGVSGQMALPLDRSNRRWIADLEYTLTLGVDT